MSIEQLKALSKEALEREDYTTLREIRLKILEWEKAHRELMEKLEVITKEYEKSQPKNDKECSLAEYLHQK